MCRPFIAFIPDGLEQGCECRFRVRVVNRIGEQFSLFGESHGSIGFRGKCQSVNRLLIPCKFQYSLCRSGIVDKQIALRITGDEPFVAKRWGDYRNGRGMRIKLMNLLKASERTFLCLPHRHPD